MRPIFFVWTKKNVWVWKNYIVVECCMGLFRDFNRGISVILFLRGRCRVGSELINLAARIGLELWD